MNAPVSLHPPQEHLQHYVTGQLSVGLSVAVSAHLEYCAECRRNSASLEAVATDEWAEPDSASHSKDFSALVQNILAQPQISETPEKEAVPRDITLEDRTMPLPKVLAKIAAEGLQWKRMPGGISQAQVRLDDASKCEFIYMAPGSKAPQHTHRGNEVMLVLDGTFSDEMGDYSEADYVVRNPSHKHQPRTQEGCLCFSVLDSPLIFTEGWLRLLNPFTRMLFLKTQRFRAGV